MNKFIIVVFLIIGFAVSISAQEKGTGIVKVRMGMALPTSDFGKNDGSLQYSSFVGNGLNMGFESAYFYNDNIGIGVLLSYNRTRIDQNRLVGAYINANNQYDTAFSNVAPFRMVAGLIGIHFNLPVNDYFAFTMKFMMGTFVVQKPAGTVKVFQNDNTVQLFSQTENISSNFAILPGLGFRINPIENWGITTDMEYIGSTLPFKFNDSGQSVEIEQAIKLFVVSFGIQYTIH